MLDRSDGFLQRLERSLSGAARRPAGPQLALLGILLLALALRLARLDGNVWYDEGLSVWAARLSLADMARWTSTDTHPPLYFALLHFWRLAAGDSEFAIRFLGIACGIIGVAGLWRLARELLPRQPWVASAAAALLTLSRFSIWWSRETRMYILGASLAILSLALTVRLRWRPRPGIALGYVIITAAMLWSLYLTALVLVIEGLYWLWTAFDRPTWRSRLRSVGTWAGMQVAVLALFLPWLLYFMTRTRHWSGATPVTGGSYLQFYATLMALGVPDHLERVLLPTLFITGIVVAGAVVQVWRRSSRRRGDAGLLFLLGAAPPVFLWAVMKLPRSFGYMPGLEPRYIFPYAPLFYLVAAWGIFGLASLARRLSRLTAAVLLAGVMLLQMGSLSSFYANIVPYDDYQSVVLTLRAHVRPGDAVVLHNDRTWPQFTYYWARPYVTIRNANDVRSPADLDPHVLALWDKNEAVWLVVNEFALEQDPARAYEGWLAGRALASHEWRAGSKRLILYAATSSRAQNLLALAPDFVPPAPPQVLAEGGLKLAGWEQPLRRMRAGNVAQAAAYVERQTQIQGTAGPGGALTVSLGSPPLAAQTVDVPPGEGIVRLPLAVSIPLSAAGSQRWHLQLDGGRPEAMGELVIVSARSPDAVSGSPETALAFRFGDPPQASLVGYSVSGAAEPGSILTVVLYWDVLRSFPSSYKVFVHVTDARGRVIAQHDGWPAGRARLTTSWQPGERIADTHEIELKPDMLAGGYTLKAGLYDPTTGGRLGPVVAGDIRQADDQAILGQITLKAAP